MSQFSVNAEITYVHEALGQLKDYLLSDEVYWNLGSDPQLTVGNLLLAIAHLKAAGKLPEADAARLAEIRGEWKSAWQNKAGREFASRLRLWLQYLQELSDNPRMHAGYYATEVRQRAVLGLLAAEALGAEDQLVVPDVMLEKLTKPGDFVWEQGAEKAFPKGKYWYLWVDPRR